MRGGLVGRALATAVTVLLLVPTAVMGQGRDGGEATPGPGGDGGDRAGFDRADHGGHGLDVALRHVSGSRVALGLQPGDLADVLVTDVVVDQDTGTTHVYLQQRHRGIAIDGAVTNVSVAGDGTVLTLGDRFFAGLRAAAPPHRPGRPPRHGIVDAARALGVAGVPGRAIDRRGGSSQRSVFAGGEVSSEPVVTQLAYVPGGRGLRLAWSTMITHPVDGRVTTVHTDADSGAELGRIEHTHEYGDGASYTVWPVPVEAPSFGPRRTEVDPADASASPYGWHDLDGVAGADTTITHGNNVHAGLSTPGGSSTIAPGTEADGGSDLHFDFPYDPGLRADPANHDAAVTNLFYWNNTLHDVLYRHGFDEDAGNFQAVNHTGQGEAGDPMLAIAHHPSTCSSTACIFVAPDGETTVMRLGVARVPVVEVAGTGQPTVYGPVTVKVSPAVAGDVLDRPFEPVDDSEGDPTDGCTEISGFTAGNIALITPTPAVFPIGPENDNCFLGTAVRRATDAGAAAVVVMGASEWGIFEESVPVVYLADEDADALRSTLPVTGSIRVEARDVALDNGVVAHEYAHGLSLRSVGGPSTTGCLSNIEQMGEGWSDLVGLMATASGGDDTDRTRSRMAYTYPPRGLSPVSTDIAVDSTTYDDLADLRHITAHAVGEHWTAPVWEVYWNLVDAHGFNADLSGDWTTGGNNLALRLLIDGMKLTPCSPGFVDARDAILTADVNLTGGANQCAIWRGFAKRGLGVGADQGSPHDLFDGTASYDRPLGTGCVLDACLTPTIVAADGVDPVLGTPGDDVILALGGARTVLAGDGDDVICTGDGDDVIDTGDGDDVVEAGSGANDVTTGPGDDIVHLGFDDDRVDAGDGEDIIHDAGGDDVLEAGSGDDTINDAGGDDVVDAGSGDDTINDAGGAGTIDGGDGDDRCLARGEAAVLTSCEWTEFAWTVDADPPGQAGDPALYSGIAVNYDEAIVHPVRIPRGSRATLSFDARWNLESGFDFGFVQLSTDSGATWASLECTDSTNETGDPQYPDDEPIPSVLQNLPGLNGDSGGWRTQDCDVSDYAGQDAQLAFRIISDGVAPAGPDGNIPSGYWVDDVMIASKVLSAGTHLYGWE